MTPGMAQESLDTDFLIVGAGIAGPAMAAALTARGYRSVILERSKRPPDTARGDHLQPRTLSILSRWGVLERLLLNGAERRETTRWLDRDGNVVLDAPVRDLDIEHPYFAFLNHERIAATLLQSALADPQLCTLIRPIRAWTLTDRRADRVDVTVERHDAPPVAIRAQVLVGADGRKSRVRDLFDAGLTEHAYERPIVVLFAANEAPDPANPLIASFSDEGIVAVIPRTGAGLKIGIGATPKDVAAWRRASEEELCRRVRTLAPYLEFSVPRYAHVYPPVAIRTRRWVHENIVLIGDACHAMHPARSQGMNVTIRCIETLVDSLPPPGDAFNPALAAFERQMQPVVGAILEANHQAGLEFDTVAPETHGAAAAALARIHANPDARRRYALRTAGYPVVDEEKTQ